MTYSTNNGMVFFEKSGPDEYFITTHFPPKDAYLDLQSIEVDSPEFQALPLEVQHEIITDVRLARKNYNLSRISDMPDVGCSPLSSFLSHQFLRTFCHCPSDCSSDCSSVALTLCCM